MSEQMLYQADGVMVSKTLVRVGNTSYPVNGIGSVYIKKSAFLGYMLGAGLSLLVGLAAAKQGESDSFGIFLFIAVVLAATGFIQKSALILRTASGDQRALMSRDKGLLTKVKDAIEQAVIQRG